MAIIDFEYGTVRTVVAGLFGTDIHLGPRIRDLVVNRNFRFELPLCRKA